MKNSSVNVPVADSGSTDQNHRFLWKWYLSDLDKVYKNGRTVFSCFSCGGGSSMGYKLAGYTVLGDCEIDQDMNKLYRANFNPKYNYLMDIRDFNKLNDYPDELRNLDVLDGSPPCSVFSMAGGREDGWNREKVFREGQQKQRLDDLFFHFIDTARVLKPKVIVAENVEGLIRGNAKGYVNEILKEFKSAGYKVQMFLLDAQTMGVPQRRKRTFFVAHRDDLDYPKLKLAFNEKPILFGEVRTEHGKSQQTAPLQKMLIEYRKKGDTDFGAISARVRGKNSMFTHQICSDDRIAATNISGSSFTRFYDGELYSDLDFINTQTFPQDYNFQDQSAHYVCGMSVPPVMMAQIATEIYNQWFSLEV